VQAIVEEIKRLKVLEEKKGSQDTQGQGASTLKKKVVFVTPECLTGTGTGFKAVRDPTLRKLLLSPEAILSDTESETESKNDDEKAGKSASQHTKPVRTSDSSTAVNSHDKSSMDSAKSASSSPQCSAEGHLPMFSHSNSSDSEKTGLLTVQSASAAGNSSTTVSNDHDGKATHNPVATKEGTREGGGKSRGIGAGCSAGAGEASGGIAEKVVEAAGEGSGDGDGDGKKSWWKLKFDDGKLINVPGEKFSIGRNDTNNLKTENTTVSGNHCHLICKEGSAVVTLHDRSMRGTIVGGEKVGGKGKSECIIKTLQWGDRVEIVKDDKVCLNSSQYMKNNCI